MASSGNPTSLCAKNSLLSCGCVSDDRVAGKESLAIMEILEK